MTKRKTSSLVALSPADLERRHPGRIRVEHGDSALEVDGEAAVPVGIGIGVAIAAIGIAFGVRVVSNSHGDE